MSFGGLDIGTSGCKLTVFNEEGKCLSSFYSEYDSSRKSDEQVINAADVWNGVKQVIRRTTEKIKDLTAIGVTSFGESFAMLDEYDNILMPSMLYTDPRGSEETARFDEDRIISVTGNKPHSMYSLPKMMWIKNNLPDIYGRAKRILLFEDFVVYMLSGVAQLDYSLAARTMAFDIRRKCWDAGIFADAGIDIGKMSKPVIAGTVAGKVRRKVAEELGLNYDTDIVTGAHDQVAAAIGAGVFDIGLAIDGTGTVECITPLFDKVPTDKGLYESNYSVVPYALPDKYVTYAFSYTGGAILKWFKNNLINYKAETANAFAELDAKISDKPTGLLVLPHFAGAATPYMDTKSKAAIIGLTLEHTGYDVYKALMEGVTYEMLLNIERLERYGIKLNMLRATGGGANSDVWLQIKADILGRPIIALNAKEAGAAGTAMLIGTSTGIYKNLEEARQYLVSERKTFYPRQEMQKRYAEIYEKYRDLYNSVRPLV